MLIGGPGMAEMNECGGVGGSVLSACVVAGLGCERLGGCVGVRTRRPPVGVCHEVVVVRVVRGEDFGGEGRGVVCLWVFRGCLWGVCVN